MAPREALAAAGSSPHAGGSSGSSKGGKGGKGDFVSKLFSFDEMAPMASVASLSDWDYFFEKRGLPGPWLDVRSDYVNGKVVTTPMGKAREAYLTWAKEQATHLARAKAEAEAEARAKAVGGTAPTKTTLIPVDLGGADGGSKGTDAAAGEEVIKFNEQLQRQTADALSLALTILRALQAVDFDRGKPLELHVLANRPLTSWGAPIGEAIEACAEQLALCMPGVPKIHCVLCLYIPSAPEGVAEDAGDGFEDDDGRGGTSKSNSKSKRKGGLEPRQRDHALNFTGINGRSARPTTPGGDSSGGGSRPSSRGSVASSDGSGAFPYNP